jgi:hypothetical protein
MATNRPIVPALDDYDEREIGGMMIGRGNRSTRRKPAQCCFVHHKPLMLCPDANGGRHGGFCQILLQMSNLRLRVLRKTFASMKEEVTEDGGKCILKSSEFVFCMK